MKFYRVVLECGGIPGNEGPEAAADIAREFAEHRRHHTNVTCTFADGKLTLVAENDFDPNGLALLDEFSDCLSAFVREFIPGTPRTLSVKSATAIDR